jgi:uncharacterized protein YecE (DUF72 family)
VTASFDLDTFRAGLAALTRRGVHIGTSSWRYQGWLGQVYSRERYEYRGKVAESRFEKGCLAEYAETFPTVCVDGAYYAFPEDELLKAQADEVPDGFRFAFKVTDSITIHRFPNVEKFRGVAGTINPEFLNADLFVERFLGPLRSIRPKVGPLIFEFSKFSETDFRDSGGFVTQLDSFLGRLPKEWHHSVEIRNREWLRPEYFACLRKHGVTHVANSWTEMPGVHEQLAMPELAEALRDSVVARFLLKPGRKYQDAVESFQPYTATQEINEEARRAAADIIRLGLQYKPRRDIFLYVNNRLEGNAPNTIRAILGLVEDMIAAEVRQAREALRAKFAPAKQLDLEI